MPKEIIHKSHPNDYIDLSVGWGAGLSGDLIDGPQTPYVRLFPLVAPVADPDDGLPRKVNGGVYICPNPDDAHLLGLKPGESVGPAQMHLNREQVNRLIRVLRNARDKAFGRDE